MAAHRADAPRLGAHPRVVEGVRRRGDDLAQPAAGGLVATVPPLDVDAPADGVGPGRVGELDHGSHPRDTGRQRLEARSQGAISSRLGEGLAFLATVGSTAPFIGLFGTVVGIYRALIKIGSSGQASIDVVAGPVGEALIMTALGLVVAVPAVLAYNWLIRRNKSIMEDLAAFTNDLHGYLMSDGKVRPIFAVAKGAAQAKTGAAPAPRGEPVRTGAPTPADR